MRFKMKPLAALASGLFVGAICLSGSALAESKSESKYTTHDLGKVAEDQMHTISIILKLRQEDELAEFISASVDPNNSKYHKFLSVSDFTRLHAPSDNDIELVKRVLSQAGFSVTEVYKNHMVVHAKASTATVNSFFKTEIRRYKTNGTSFIKPTRKLTMPSSLSGLVLTATGLDTEPKAHPNLRHFALKTKADDTLSPESTKLIEHAATTNAPGFFTVADVASLYNVTPLYAQKITGRGRTVGIATLATFKPADAYTYWAKAGLTVAQDRITQVKLLGGAGTDGSDETSLDVEQAGGLAPDAKVVVYEAPNTEAGFIDVFYKAAEENRVDTLSVSWGAPEIVQDTEILASQHQAFMALAAQGITLFAASGDQGAFDINGNSGEFAYPNCSQLLSIDAPGNDPYVVSAGGLTLATIQTMKNGSIKVEHDRPWAWDYMQNYFTTYYGSEYYYANMFPVGGGGGVSVRFPVPDYQKKTAGVQTSAPNQSLGCQTKKGWEYIVSLPEGYAGRNTPDISLNADPNTGYSVYSDGKWQYGWGGTSFVAPQLNGITALLTQLGGTRLGHINPQLYGFLTQYGYASNSPFQAITSGDNEFWKAEAGYNQASGLGGLDATNLARAFGWTVGTAVAK